MLKGYNLLYGNRGLDGTAPNQSTTVYDPITNTVIERWKRGTQAENKIPWQDQKPDWYVGDGSAQGAQGAQINRLKSSGILK